MSNDLFAPLPKSEVIKAIEHRSPVRVPQVMTQWWGEGLGEQHGALLDPLAKKYPQDAVLSMISAVDPSQMGLSWYDPKAPKTGHDANVVISDWSQLDEFIAKLPNPQAANIYSGHQEVAQRLHKLDRYLLTGWWYFLFERPWSLRGMENLLMDYYLYPEETHRLNDALCTLYEGYLERLAADLQPDGFWTSDDLGNQRQLMMKPEHFREFLLPYYCRVGATCKRLGMHFWLHSCGDNTEILDDLIDAGVRVFHPVQKHTMDAAATAKRFGDRICFLAGFDVQHMIQEGTPDEVRGEVRQVIDTFDRPDGGMILAAGNGIVGGTPLANIEAFLDEGVRYGWQHRERFAK